MNPTWSRRQAYFSGTRASRGAKPFLLALLLGAASLSASAESRWCDWLPFLPNCKVDKPPTTVDATAVVTSDTADSRLSEVTGFGSNPGDLKMFTYRPANLGPSRPLVVALHGCAQEASTYDDEPGWVQLADKYRFALLLPEQQLANNPTKCFNWFVPAHNERDKGEAFSIKQMIDRIKVDANIDPKKVYVTGLSGGGAMTAVMLATYPELFAGGAIVAGVPYKCADGIAEAGKCLSPWTKDLTPAEWGGLVRKASSHAGQFPRVSIWHGTSDKVVNPKNQQELVDQWTHVLGIDQIPDAEDTINGHARKLYKDGQGRALVETVSINDMGHGTPIAPESADNPCGEPAQFILSVGVCSSAYIARFWGIDAP